VWAPQSDYDEAALRRACRSLGVEVYIDDYGPDRDSYIQIVERGISARIMERAYVQVIKQGAVQLPQEFPVMVLGEHDRLFVLMPTEHVPQERWRGSVHKHRNDPGDVLRHRTRDLASVRCLIGSEMRDAYP
jgi:hypothetical protein